MYTVLIILCTILLIIDCLLLGLLVIVQLPKKEAGIGMAFGGAATDALFGAGSGTALSSLTTYTATAFFILVFALSIINNHARHGGGSAFRSTFQQTTVPTQAPTTSPSTATVTAPAGSTSTAPAIPLTITTNYVTPAPATIPPSNAPAAPAK